jgi:hypothetical protein
MEKHIAFIVGHANFGKSYTVRALKELCGSGGRRVMICDTEFLTRDMSNDDLHCKFVEFMASTHRPSIVATLCPKFDPSKYPQATIGKTLQSLRKKGYALHFWVIKHQWENMGDGMISVDEIDHLKSYGDVKVCKTRDLDSRRRAEQFQAFVSGVLR